MVWRMRSEHHSWRYDLLFPLLAKLPRGLAYTLADWQSRYFFHKRVAQREAIASQMRAVFTDVSSAQIDGWVRDYFRMVEQEALDTWFLDHDDFVADLRLKGFEQVEELRKQGRRVILTGGHYGRFWLAGPAMYRRGYPVGTITRDGAEENVHGLHPAEHKYRLAKLKKLAEVLGGPFLIEGRDLRPLYRELDENLITLIFDVPYLESTAGRVTVPFFKGNIEVPAGVYKIAKKTKAVVVPFYIDDQKGEKVTVEFSKPLEPNNYNNEGFMRLLTTELERRVRAQPGYWWLWEALPLLWSKNNEPSTNGARSQ